MFDSSQPFKVPILSGGEKRCEVRFPTDAEWCERSRKQKTIRHQLGRGKSQADIPDMGKTDLQLFAKIRLDQGGPEFDEAEATTVLQKIGRCEVIDAEREGDQYRIQMRCPGGSVVHYLRIPTQKAISEYGRAAVKVTHDRRHSEMLQHLEPSGALWDSVQVRTEGYANGHVPLIHKDVAVVELIVQVDRAMEEDDPED